MTAPHAYAALDHRFSVRVDRGPTADAIRAVLAPLATSGTVAGCYEVTTVDDSVAIAWEGEPVVAAGSRPLAVATLLWHVNQLAVQCSRRHLLIHAAAVAPPGRGAFIVTGPSGAGKSSMAAALAARGWRYLTDEVVAIDSRSAVLPYPRALALSGPARRWAEDLGGPAVLGVDDEIHVDPSTLGAALATEPLPVEGVLLLDGGERTARATHATAGDAALALASACFNLREHADHGLTILRDLVLLAPTWRVSVDGVGAAADAAEHLARATAA